MLEIIPTDKDDKRFIEIIERLLRAEVAFAQPAEVFIVKVENWFDFKWRGFSHKIFGAVGVWRDPLRVPPFTPDRILEETYFQNSGESYLRNENFQLHIYQQSAWNAERKINRRSAVYVWFSGETIRNSQASVMIYRFGEDSQNSWYASFIKKLDWQIYKTDNISKAEVSAMIQNDFDSAKLKI